MKEIQSKLIYIDSLSRIFGYTYKFIVEIPPIFTRQENKNNLITLSLVDAQIRQTWYNVRESNKNFWLVNYDTTLGNYTTTTMESQKTVASGIKIPLALWQTVPDTRDGLAWSPDTPNHWLITITEGNYDIYGLAQAIQNALNDGENGASTPVGTNSFPNSENTTVTMNADDGVKYTWAGEKWFPEVGGVGQGLYWTVEWIKETGKMEFKYSGGQATTNLAFDFRNTGNFMFCDGYDSQDASGIDFDTLNSTYELMGFDRHGFQSNLDILSAGQGIPTAEWCGGTDAMLVGDPVTGVTNAINDPPTLPYPMMSNHPCTIGAPKSIYINTDLPISNIASFRKVATQGGIATASHSEFSNSTIFAKIANNQQYFSTIFFQSQGEHDYSLMTDDLEYINRAQFWLSDEWGFLLKTPHDWGLTLRWTESIDDGKARNTSLEDTNNLLQMLLLQKETEGTPLEMSEPVKPNDAHLAPKQVAEKEAKKKVEQERQLQGGNVNAVENIRKDVLEKEINDEYAKGTVFGDEGGAAPQQQNGDWVREYKKGYKGDGGDLFPEEWRHLRHISAKGVTRVPYSFAGPGTRYKERIKRGDVGINPLDRASKEHDRVYADPLATIEEIKRADLALEKTAEAIAQKYPELWNDAKLVVNLFKAKRRAVKWGLAKWNLFAAGGKH